MSATPGTAGYKPVACMNHGEVAAALVAAAYKEPPGEAAGALARAHSRARRLRRARPIAGGVAAWMGRRCAIEARPRVVRP